MMHIPFSKKILSTSLVASLLLTPSAYALSNACQQRANNTVEKLKNCLTTKGLISHLQAFQNHADKNKDMPGTRFTGTAGDEASRNYIINKLRAAGYQVSLQSVPITYTYVTSASVAQTSPVAKTYQKGIDYIPYIGSGENDITAKIETPSGQAVGCTKEDFAGFTAGNIALIQRGGLCWPREKAINAIAAGASGVIIYNDAPGGGMLYPTLGGEPIATIPILFTTTDVANALKAQIVNGITPALSIKFKTVTHVVNAQNIFAETKAGDPNHIIMVGAHIDSSPANAGMNDNASAAAAILETALALKNVNVTNKLRFAWWTGEELGLLGSEYYVANLSTEEKSKIAMYLNYEILGAPNGGRFIMGTADGITPPGSEKITQFYADYFKAENLKYYVIDPTFANAAARSDMHAFSTAKIPNGFLVTGAELPWNAMFTQIFTDLPNRTIGLSTHPCYHKACDKLTLDNKTMTDPNFDFDLYTQMTKAAAAAIFSFAMTPEKLS